MTILGVPGRAGAAHVMLLRSIRVEGTRDEFAPEAADFVEDPKSIFVMCRRSGQGGGGKGCHDGALAVVGRGFCRLGARFLRAEAECPAELIKRWLQLS